MELVSLVHTGKIKESMTQYQNHHRHSYYSNVITPDSPVSNEDYEEVQDSQNDTDSDVVLIKAVLGAIMKPKKEVKKGVIIWVIIAIVAAIIGFAIFGGGGAGV